MKKPITEVFSIQAPATITVDVRDNANHTMIPRTNPDYVFTRPHRNCWQQPNN
jgi:hypothetical protein